MSELDLGCNAFKAAQEGITVVVTSADFNSEGRVPKMGKGSASSPVYVLAPTAVMAPSASIWSQYHPLFLVFYKAFTFYSYRSQMCTLFYMKTVEWTWNDRNVATLPTTCGLFHYWWYYLAWTNKISPNYPWRRTSSLLHIVQLHIGTCEKSWNHLQRKDVSPLVGHRKRQWP